MKSSPPIWRLLSKCQIDGEDFIFFVAFLENVNFNLGSDTFGNPIFQKVLQNWPSSLIISVPTPFENAQR
jgi:hypothetical protein